MILLFLAREWIIHVPSTGSGLSEWIDLLYHLNPLSSKKRAGVKPCQLANITLWSAPWQQEGRTGWENGYFPYIPINPDQEIPACVCLSFVNLTNFPLCRISFEINAFKITCLILLKDNGLAQVSEKRSVILCWWKPSGSLGGRN